MQLNAGHTVAANTNLCRVCPSRAPSPWPQIHVSFQACVAEANCINRAFCPSQTLAAYASVDHQRSTEGTESLYTVALYLISVPAAGA